MEPLEARRLLAVMDFDFSTGNGGFTTRGLFDGAPWRYTGSQWQTVTNLEAESQLISPQFTAEGDTVTYSITHTYEFMVRGDSSLNGGLLDVSINNGPYRGDLVEVEGGYPVTAADGGIVHFRFAPGWGGSSGGEVTDVARVAVSAGDTVQFRLRAGWIWEFDPNEDVHWQVPSISVDTGGAAAAAATVVDRHLLYNDSFFDSEEDDAAIATDKTALLPGEAATFANYSSFSSGLNGVMVDIQNLASEPTLATIGDFFAFAMGNSDTPGDWAEAPAPVEVTVRPEEGLDGSDRVTILWENNAIANSWLETTVLATAETGLAEPDVFYYGNAVGDSGNSAVDTSVNAQDIGGARDNPHNFLNRALIDDAFDYNRDSLVNAQDIGIARDNPTNFLNDLNLISPPALAAAATPETDQQVAAPIQIDEASSRGVIRGVQRSERPGLIEQYSQFAQVVDGQVNPGRTVAVDHAIDEAGSVWQAEEQLLELLAAEQAVQEHPL